MEIASGREIDPSAPKPDDIDIATIAHALSLQCRYNGHCRRFYSVAEHSVLVAKHLAEAGANDLTLKWGLLHDASEAYLGDVVMDIKRRLINYRPMEEAFERAIASAFDIDLDGVDFRVVKRADLAALMAEARCLMPSKGEEWGIAIPPSNHAIYCWTPEQAEIEFLTKATQLEIITTASYLLARKAFSGT